MSVKILLTGCRGQLGRELQKQFNFTDKYDVISLDRNALDVTDRRKVFCAVRHIRPQVVINCAAYNDIEGCERNKLGCLQVNAFGAFNLSTAAHNAGAAIVQISTDHVFDGQIPEPRREYDIVNPVNCYGRSKEFSEVLIRDSNHRHFILRTGWLYSRNNGFINSLVKSALHGNELNIANDLIGTPTSAADLASCIIKLIGTENYGTFHAVNGGAGSWYGFCRKILQIKGIDTVINGVSSCKSDKKAKWPPYSVLDNNKLKKSGIYTFRYWEESLEECLNDSKPACIIG